MDDGIVVEQGVEIKLHGITTVVKLDKESQFREHWLRGNVNSL